MSREEPGVTLLQGTLDLLILQALSRGPAHGYGIAQWLHRISRDQLRIEEGSLYPALHRLEKRGLLEPEWGVSENNRRARYYRLTTAGRAGLRIERAGWLKLAGLIAAVLEAEPA